LRAPKAEEVRLHLELDVVFKLKLISRKKILQLLKQQMKVWYFQEVMSLIIMALKKNVPITKFLLPKII